MTAHMADNLMQSVPTNTNTSNFSSAPGTSASARTPQSLEVRLVKNRLGIYSALFFALRAKHPPTAAHCLRVALGVSKWAAMRRMTEPERELLEIAALLHDLGKLGVPDRVLQKTEELSGNENSLMELHSELAVEVLAGAGASPELLNVIRTYRNRIDGHSNEFQDEGQSPASAAAPTLMPLAARMLAIADAFDSMTSEQPFRRAMSREMAINELFKNAGRQFDANLITEFAQLVTQPLSELDKLVGKRWLNELTPYPTPGFCDTSVPASSGAMQTLIDTLYHHRLLESMDDAAIYVDFDGRVLSWNRAAERLTGRNSAAMLHQSLSADLIGLKTPGGGKLVDDRCPIHLALKTQVAVNQNLLLVHVDSRELTVQFNTLLVHNAKRELCGAIFMIRDASEQADLEEQVQSLHEIATTDNLTAVSNRAELSRYLPEFVASHLSSSQPGSLIICDIDHFKRINDTHGHPAGDEALITFASVLKQLSRAGDMVARYGGEEFVLLCANCDNAAATSRAEDIRRALESTPIPSLRSQCMTASFGVTEIQLGDSDDTLLARADRALLLAKDSGRNRVVQLGRGLQTEEEPTKKASWFSWFSAAEAKATLLEKDYLTAVPRDIAIERLSGFINDHKAEIIRVDDNRVSIRINTREVSTNRRVNDRTIELLMEVVLEHVEMRSASGRGSSQRQTKMHVTFRAAKARDRRIVNVFQQATSLVISFRSYLVAQELTEDLIALIVPPK
jgi:diguanylate cyclase (GGDEF)-like protein/PAS domain S-box-containing protein